LTHFCLYFGTEGVSWTQFTMYVSVKVKEVNSINLVDLKLTN
jgi:hypothetical protein